MTGECFAAWVGSSSRRVMHEMQTIHIKNVQSVIWDNICIVGFVRVGVYQLNLTESHVGRMCLSICTLHVYLTPVKTQLLQYNLTRDLMQFYHSDKK